MSCPTSHQITDCLTGKLDNREMDRIYSHAEACAECSAIFDSLECRPPRELDRLLRRLGQAQPPNVDRACEGMISQASGLIREDVGERGAHNVAEPPRVIRDYELHEVVGQGGMGTVYRAWHTRLHRSVALKVLASHRSGSGSAVAHFNHEMAAVGKLDHPHIVRALDAGVHDGTHYLVMELLNGVDAAAIVHAVGQLSAADASAIAEHAARGLDYAHRRGLVHRDVKPSNLMVTSEGRALVMDLGLALNAISDDEGSSQHVLGTAQYIAPEQANNSSLVTDKADVYSLGCTMYHLLSGQPPFVSENSGDPADILAAHVSQPPRPLAELRLDIAEDITAIVHRMMQKSPRQRPALPEVIAGLAPFAADSDLKDLVQRARAALGETAAAYSYSQHLPVSQNPTRRNRWFGFAGAALLLFLAAWALHAAPWNTIRDDSPTSVAAADPVLSGILKSDAVPASMKFTTSFVEAADGEQRVQIRHEIGRQIQVDIFRPADSTQPLESFNSWDLLELKLSHPAAFELWESIWEATGSSARTEAEASSPWVIRRRYDAWENAADIVLIIINDLSGQARLVCKKPAGPCAVRRPETDDIISAETIQGLRSVDPQLAEFCEPAFLSLDADRD